jgi:hypothetical protein
MMMGLLAAKPWKYATLDFLYHMNNIIVTHKGKEVSKLSHQLCCRGADYLAIEMTFLCWSFAVIEKQHTK